MDFSVKAPWGKIACVSWGSQHKPAVLLVHGYMDSAATFIPLVRSLPPDYHYVAIDMPGHGRSDPFPVGPVVSHAHQLEAARRVVEHLGWTSFVFVSHSVGFIIGRNMMRKEKRPSINWEAQRNKTLSYEDAVNSVMKKRKVNREQAEVLLSRGLVMVGEEMYRFSWEPSMKKVTSLPITEETLHSLMKQSPPTLNIVADDSVEAENAVGVGLIQTFADTIHDFLIFNVTGTHDVHVTNPERFSDVMSDFIKVECNRISFLCKL